ncbi:MAG TPA: F0F1 ATP synthase subunit A [Ignavibacteria bacterium]|nr:F0F1 ATP synthase subunit A [Ignavibacteria bacterium]HRJ98962.1 F0F1 ATP synthase subunit A [Ignavibacteria bacterium]
MHHTPPFKTGSFLKRLAGLFLILFTFTFCTNLSFAADSNDDKSGISSDIKAAEKETLDIIDKVVDHDYIDFYFLGKLYLPKFEPVHFLGMTFDFSITKTLFMMILSAVILIMVLLIAASGNKKNKYPRGIGNLVESLIVFVRDDIVVPNMGKEGLKLMPFFLTLFFFIMFANLIGLFPFMAQPTKNINVTAGLALVTFFITQIKGIQAHGFGGYLKALVPPGVPVFVLPIMVIVEFIGLFTKPFSLLMRLFANITAGSIIIFSLIGLVFVMEYAGSVIAVPFALFIYFLEIFIALLQAYIFTMLSVLYINMAMHHH